MKYVRQRRELKAYGEKRKLRTPEEKERMEYGPSEGD